MSLNQWTKLLQERPMDVFRQQAVSPPDAGEWKQVLVANPNGGLPTVNYNTGFATPTTIPIDGMFARFFRPGTSQFSGEYKQAEVDRPVGHIKLKPATDPGLLGALVFDVKVDPAADRIPCYFLPWSSKVLVEMTIPEKKTESDEDDDPNIFFTAAINGCSVFASGDPRSPRVGHAGISQGTTPYGGEASAFWRDLVTSCRAAQGIHGGKVFEINNTDYINQTGVSGQSQTANADQYKRWLDRMPRGPFTVEEVIPWGCVFGIRYGKLWSFYLQENVRIKRYRLHRVTKKKTQRTPRKLLGIQTGERVTEVMETVEVREDHNINVTMLVRPFYPGPRPSQEFLPKFRRV